MATNAPANVVPVTTTEMPDGTAINAENVNGVWNFTITAALYSFASRSNFARPEIAMGAAFRVIAALSEGAEILPAAAPAAAPKRSHAKKPENAPAKGNAPVPQIITNTPDAKKPNIRLVPAAKLPEKPAAENAENDAEEIEEETDGEAATETPETAKPAVAETANKPPMNDRRPKLTLPVAPAKATTPPKMPKKAAAPNRTIFLANLREELQAAHIWAAKVSKLEMYMEKVSATLETKQNLWNPNEGECAQRAWAKMGMANRVNIKALRALPE